MMWLKRFGADLARPYLDGVRAIAALPWLFGAVVALELAQHVMEVRAGFFQSYEISRALQDDPGRMLFGWAKLLSIYVGGFFVIRHLAGRVNGPIAAAALRFLPYTVYSMLLFTVMFYARNWFAPEAVMTVRSVVGMSQIFVEPLLMLWFVSAATDGAVHSPWASMRELGWFYAYALPVFFIARLPLYTLHRQLNLLAMGQSLPMLAAILLLDAMVLALIISVIPAIAVRITRRWAERPRGTRSRLALA